MCNLFRCFSYLTGVGSYVKMEKVIQGDSELPLSDTKQQPNSNREDIFGAETAQNGAENVADEKQKEILISEDQLQLEDRNAVTDVLEGEKRVGEDEPDRVSIFSLFMEKDFRYYFQHPYFRLMIAYLVTVCNFIIYAEDPVAHSNVECFIPVVGNCFAFICSHYPENAWALLKVVLWLLAILCGLFLGKLLVHKQILSEYFNI